MHQRVAVSAALLAIVVVTVGATGEPLRVPHGMVVAQEPLATAIGVKVLREGGSAVDAAVATAFALAVTHPTAGNIGGGGFLVYRPAMGVPIAYDFREMAPAASTEEMFLVEGAYDAERHHNSHISVGVPGTVAGLHLAWSEQGRLPWQRLVQPAIELARDGFALSHRLASSLAAVLPRMQRYPASIAKFSKNGELYQSGELFTQLDLARTLARVSEHGPEGFYGGETARLIAAEMQANGGLITVDDLAAYEAKKRPPIRGTYRGYEIISMPPISSGGTALIQMLNILEGYDLRASGYASAQTVHVIVETMRRAYADRARYLGDPDFNPTMPIERLVSKSYAERLRRTILGSRASRSSPDSFEWPSEGEETTHFSIVDAERNAVSMTYTLEQGYGSKIVVPGGGFLLNNEMGDFNGGPGLTTEQGLIGTQPNLAESGKRMLSSMTPTILTKDGHLFMVTGTPGGRTIINTVLHTILNVIDFEMNIQAAVDAPRFHHQWLPDRIVYERHGLSPDTIGLLKSRGHTLGQRSSQGVAQAIVVDATENLLEGAADRRSAGSTAAGY